VTPEQLALGRLAIEAMDELAERMAELNRRLDAQEQPQRPELRVIAGGKPSNE
jgi:hypothetical protein